jgi:hypothetical protein
MDGVAAASPTANLRRGTPERGLALQTGQRLTLPGLPVTPQADGAERRTGGRRSYRGGDAGPALACPDTAGRSIWLRLALAFLAVLRFLALASLAFGAFRLAFAARFDSGRVEKIDTAHTQACEKGKEGATRGPRADQRGEAIKACALHDAVLSGRESRDRDSP